MWGRFWSGLSEIVQPYPGKISVDPTPAMIKQNYTVRRMFELGDDFFQSMGLKPLPETFYNLSLIEKPKDPNRKLICHPSAWDFYDGKDFRVKMCTRRIFDDFMTLHHELGHIQYYMQYAHHPISYRDGANGGFHEAIGELMGMSVATTKHLRSIGLFESDENDPDVEINFLRKQSLRSVMSLPLHLVLDTWRWKIFKDKVPVQQWNREFWDQRLKMVGVIPPIPRDDDLDLDPTALLHVHKHTPMIIYFTRTILQYQFSEALCRAAGHSGPLHRCDIYNSTEAGTALAKMMQMGSSRPWPDALEALTGYREMSTKPLLNYFRPLQEWLEKENERNEDFIGWSK